MNLFGICSKKLYLSLILLTCNAFIAPTKVFCMEQQSTGKIILVIGTSSSGKSTICKQLSNRIAECYSVIPTLLSMDDMNGDFDIGLSHEERNHFPREWVTDEIRILCKKTMGAASSNNLVIVDAILQESIEGQQIDQTTSFVGFLKSRGYDVFTVLVFCPVMQLVKNVSTRNSSPNPNESRSPTEIVSEFFDAYVPSASDEDEELAQITSKPEAEEFINPKDILELLEMFSQMQVERHLIQAKMLLLKKLEKEAIRRTPSPVAINPQKYNFLFKNDSKEDFETKLSVLANVVCRWLR